ncbi:MAG TPA: hypothetical protein VGB14_02685 [Acidimicrobiales bacterium]
MMMVALGACSDDDPRAAQPEITAPTSTTTTTQATTTSTEPTPDRLEAEPPPDEPRPDIDVNVTYPSTFTEAQIDVVEAYRGFWHAVYAASDPVDLQHPLLRQYTTVDRLQGVQAGLAEHQEHGWIARIPNDGVYQHAVLSVDIDGTEATLRDCSVDSAQVIDAESQSIVDDDVVTRETEFLVVEVAGVWRVGGTEPRLIEEWNGVSGCAEQLS